jgi:glycosyltransferase involved in cell wall biosynthesis
MADNAKILVSVGIPVFNGEAGIARALESILAQDYPDLEIIISDNGSTDGTRAICERFAAADARINYHRENENRGAIWNFNRVFELSTGQYFMWAAHDDQREPTFVSACVAKMEACPGAVLCQAHTSMFIEGREELLCVADLDTFEGVHGLVDRYRETLKHFPASAIYGLYRSSAMRKTKLMEKSIASDLAFIQELSIHGDFVQVPEVLFRYFGRKKWNTVHDDYRAFFGKGPKPWWYLPFVALFANHWRRVGNSELTPSEKVQLWRLLVTHETERSALKVAIKVGQRVVPPTLKQKVGCHLYWRWMHSPNVRPGDHELYVKRVIGPSLGWWS